MTTHRRGRPPESVGADTRARIMSEAIKLFAVQGFHGTSVAEIGHAAGVQAGALYYHIKSKDELLWCILDDYISEMLASTEEVFAAHAAPDERLKAVLTNHITKIIHFRQQVAIELRDRSALSKPHFTQLQRKRDALQSLWQRTFEDGVAAGVFRTDDRVVTNSVLTMASLVARWYRDHGTHSVAATAEIIVDLVLTGVVATGSASGGRKPA